MKYKQTQHFVSVYIATSLQDFISIVMAGLGGGGRYEHEPPPPSKIQTSWGIWTKFLYSIGTYYYYNIIQYKNNRLLYYRLLICFNTCHITMWTVVAMVTGCYENQVHVK